MASLGFSGLGIGNDRIDRGANTDLITDFSAIWGTLDVKALN